MPIFEDKLIRNVAGGVASLNQDIELLQKPAGTALQIANGLNKSVKLVDGTFLDTKFKGTLKGASAISSVPNSAWTQISLGNVIYDTFSIAPRQGYFDIPAGFVGYADIEFLLNFYPNTTGIRRGVIYKNALPLYDNSLHDVLANISGYGANFKVSMAGYPVVGGDSFFVAAMQNSGAALNVNCRSASIRLTT